MCKISKEVITTQYAKYKRKAQSSINRSDYDSCLKNIELSAFIGYTFYLGYRDDELESLLEDVSNNLLVANNNGVMNPNDCVFYDSFSTDNAGLSQQYLNALISGGYKIYYLADNNAVLKPDSAIGLMLSNYEKAEVNIIPNNLSNFKKAQYIYDYILTTKASKLFIHSKPWSSPACTAFYALPNTITQYKINLTDHTFWIGTGFIDYSCEFRPYGCHVSLLKRGIAKDRLLYLPFFPVMNRKKFDGFPINTEGKLILFSGGSYYKIFDKDDSFFKMVKAILDACPEIIMLFAGAGDQDHLHSKLAKYQLEGRMIPIGQRSDITEVFEHCDIYLNTYPIGGGLMCQYAAQMGKPIVSYHTPGKSKAEEFVCQDGWLDISDESLSSLVERVKHLVENKDERIAYGENIRRCVVTPEKFNTCFTKSVETNTNQNSFGNEEDFKENELDIEDVIDAENNTKEFQRSFSKHLGISALWECPGFLFNSLTVWVKNLRLIKKLINNKI